jgi:hypothetical protein
MNPALIRDRLHEQIDRLPDELVEEVADFVLFLAAKQKISPNYQDWDERQWQEFALGQFFRAEDEEDEVEYSLKDAREVYHP